MANGYRIEEITTGSGGDAGYGTEYALIDPEGQVVTYIDANRDDFGNILGYHVSNDLGYTPIDLDAINAKAASGVVPFGQGMGPALGYEYGMKNSEGNLFRKFDAQGNLTEFLDQHGQWQPASTFQPAGFEFNPATGNFETSYRSPNSPRANIRESTATTVNPFREDQGGWLGEGGWRNLGMLALSGLSAGLAGAAGGAGIAGGAAGANTLENAALLSQALGGGAGAANAASSVMSLLSSPAAQIGLNVADIGSKAYDFLKNNQSFSQQDIERLQAEGELPADLSSLAGYGGLPQPSGAPQGMGGLGSLLSGDQQDKDEDDEDKKRKAEDFLGLLSQTTQTNVKTPPVAKIDYMYDIGGDSVFATPKQESLMPSPFEQAPEPVEGAMPRYQYYDPTGGYLYAGGGMVALKNGGSVFDALAAYGSDPEKYESIYSFYTNPDRPQIDAEGKELPSGLSEMSKDYSGLDMAVLGLLHSAKQSGNPERFMESLAPYYDKKVNFDFTDRLGPKNYVMPIVSPDTANIGSKGRRGEHDIRSNPTSNFFFHEMEHTLQNEARGYPSSILNLLTNDTFLSGADKETLRRAKEYRTTNPTFEKSMLFPAENAFDNPSEVLANIAAAAQGAAVQGKDFLQTPEGQALFPTDADKNYFYNAILPGVVSARPDLGFFEPEKRDRPAKSDESLAQMAIRKLGFSEGGDSDKYDDDDLYRILGSK